jgi:ribosomal protein S18 acetylase RimI-like enzyme
VREIETRAYRAKPSDAAAAVEILVGAFTDDPAWRWIIRDPVRRPDGLRIIWQAFVANALRYSALWITEGATAAAVWIPPDGEEMTEAQAAEMTAKYEELLGEDAPHAFAAMDEFDKAHPHHAPHFTLSLLGTDVSQRGHGYGLSLLAAGLAAVDDADLPTYLEASNPVNVALYERYGFELFGEFVLPAGGPTVATMWRPRSSELR